MLICPGLIRAIDHDLGIFLYSSREMADKGRSCGEVEYVEVKTINENRGTGKTQDKEVNR